MAIFLEDENIQSRIMLAYLKIAETYENSGQQTKAIDLYLKCLNSNTPRQANLDMVLCSKVGDAYYELGEYQKTIEYYEKHLTIAEEIGDLRVQANAHCNLGNVYIYLGQYYKAIEYLENATEIGSKMAEGTAYRNLGCVYEKLGEYEKAIAYTEKSLSIASEIVDRKGEGQSYVILGGIYKSLGKYHEAIVYQKRSLSIAREIGDRSGEGKSYGNLGICFDLLGEYHKAIEYHERSLSIEKEIGDRHGEGLCYGNLGICFISLGKYHTAIKYQEKYLSIAKEIGDISGEGHCYESLGIAYHSLGEFHKGIKYFEKGLSIAKKIHEKPREGSTYGNLGNAYTSLGEYRKAIEYYEKCLSIVREIGDRPGEAECHGNIGNVYVSLAMYHKAIQCYEKSLSIYEKICMTKGEGKCCLNLGNAYQAIREYHKAIECHKKSLMIAKEIGDRQAEGHAYGSLGLGCYTLGEYHKAIEYYENCLRIARDLIDRRLEAFTFVRLGDAYDKEMEYDKAIEYYEKSLKISKEIGIRKGQALALCNMACTYLNRPSKDHRKAKELLAKSIESYEELYDELKEKDEFKISIVETFIRAYKTLCSVNIESGELDEALLACERGRARALGDVLRLKYAISKGIPLETNSLELADVMTIASTCNASILFCDIHHKKLTARLWVVAPQCQSIFFYDEMSEIESLTNIVTSLSEKDQQKLANQGYFQHLIEISFANMDVRKGVQCEDRSLGASEFEDQETAVLSDTLSDAKEFAASVFQALTRCVYDEEEEDKPLEMLYARLISPVQSHLTQEEIVIVPDGPLFMVPFAALQDPITGKFLSETKRIRLAPSLTTLKYLQESSDDHHYKSGALIVGNPATGKVMHRGKETTMPSLPGAEEEARKIADLLGVEPLIGTQATKQAILRKLQDGVSVIHFAAHGSQRNGQILLAPSVTSTANSIPEEEDYILTMKEAQESGIRAQLVVLSCCHSGRGEIKSEGVVGMTRAFLAAGARAVVASLWAIDDGATKLFMLKFYSHLKKGESASKSLQQAMKEMRETEKYKKPKYWAAFFLIGDDVTISV